MSERTRPAHATVCLTVDFDALSLWLQWGARGPQALSRGEFGARVGAPRLLELAQRHSIPTTWFVPGHTADTYPEVTRQITERGHEIGNHGYLHEVFDSLSADEARSALVRGTESIERVTGCTPRGFRLPAGEARPDLFEMLLELDFEYDSSLLAGDFFAHWCRRRDTYHTDGPPEFGSEIPLVEIPLSIVMNDFHHFEFNLGSPQLPGHDGPQDVEPIWRSQFDYMYDNNPGGTLVVIVHPQCIGQGLRTAMLDRFVEYCVSRDRVRFETMGTVAREFRQTATKPSPDTRAKAI